MSTNSAKIIPISKKISLTGFRVEWNALNNKDGEIFRYLTDLRLQPFIEIKDLPNILLSCLKTEYPEIIESKEDIEVRGIVYSVYDSYVEYSEIEFNLYPKNSKFTITEDYRISN